MRPTFPAALIAISCAFGPAAAAPSQLDAAIDKAIAAMGGADNVHALKSLVLRGFHYEGAGSRDLSQSGSGNSVMARMQPGLRLVGCRPELPGCDGQWGAIAEGWDGSGGWELSWPRQRLVHTVNKAEQALRCGAEFLPLFVDYKQRGFTGTWLGPRIVLGKKTVAMKIDQAGCSSATYYFDPKNYALEMSQLTIPVHARGALRPTMAVYSKFITVAGVQWPAVSRDVDLSTGKVLDGIEWTSIQANVISDRKIFEAPETHPAGITAVVLQMLAMAAKHQSVADVMTHYQRFRATPEGKAADVSYDMNWLGYELLKVDDYSAAAAVFNQMIAENPTSSTVYVSLGDAYAQQGNRKAAVNAYDRALTLNPKNEAAKAKRAQLAG
jgi:tetratricopeptide (TPR) repeat protein